MKDSIKNLEWRYAVKKFDSEKILSDDKLERLKKAFNLTATSYGLQPIRMVVVQNKELQEKLVASSYGQQQVSQASHVLIICIERVVDKEFIVKYFDRVKNIRNTSESIITPFEDALVNSFSKKDIKEVKDWATNQAYLALGNLLTVCAFEEIDSCPMEGFSPEAYDELLELEQYGLSSVLVLPVGYRAKDDMFADMKKVRRPLKDSIIYISKA
ncbi:nitroreductase [Sediminicola sp. YIK13]|uniref:NAD(P)H-dependent oxidoreductase n=1 Tax=Sediminicola sp. YIK13 TaxID=1453352 RepID=UPI00071FB09D|nr:NAD(P)H-dependent oxidoreductase [Sediminicola sp. YIK13]ALM06929.1 nitroreductase [Sediminicola sp. YIK13]